MFKKLLELLKPKKQLKADVSKSLTPHRCPVCNGNGLVPNGFYTQTSGHWSTNSITPETCRSCNGAGVVWGVSDSVCPKCGYTDYEEWEEFKANHEDKNRSSMLQ